MRRENGARFVLRGASFDAWGSLGYLSIMSRKGMGRLVGGCLVLSLTGCPANKAAEVAVALAYNAAGAAVEREVNKSCYGTCSYGTECNHETGFCEPIEERSEVSNASARQLTLDEKCAEAQIEYTKSDARGLGTNHPEMKTLRRVLEACERLRADPDETNVRCATYELDVVALEASYYGPKHPDVVAAQSVLDECRAKPSFAAR